MEKEKNFVAINTIDAELEYIERFEMLFKSRARAIDTMEGFHSMQVLKPTLPGESYLIVSFWESEEHFRNWSNSPEFLEGHKRGFADLSKARSEGKKPPMHSQFRTYTVLAR